MEYLTPRFTFKKSERISSEKDIAEIFYRGNSFFIFPYKVFYLCETSEENLVRKPQVLITVSKKNFRKAVDRNLLKRRTREAYRTQKYILKPKQNNGVRIAFLYLHKEILTSMEVDKKINAILTKLCGILKEDSK